MWRVLGAMAMLASAAQASPPPGPAAAPAADAASRGLYVALRVCSACHKVALPGEGPDSAAPSFAAIHAGHDAKDLHRLLVQISHTGHHEMPPIPMSPGEIDDVAAYIASVPTSPPATAPARENRRAPPDARRIAVSLSTAAP